MPSDLSELYNDGLVPPPDLSTDIPSLRQPTNRLTPEQMVQSRNQLVVAVIVLIALVCLLLVVGGVLFAWTILTRLVL